MRPSWRLSLIFFTTEWVDFHGPFPDSLQPFPPPPPPPSCLSRPSHPPPDPRSQLQGGTKADMIRSFKD